VIGVRLKTGVGVGIGVRAGVGVIYSLGW